MIIEKYAIHRNYHSNMQKLKSSIGIYTVQDVAICR
jgi:hypothetical protein